MFSTAPSRSSSSSRRQRACSSSFSKPACAAQCVTNLRGGSGGVRALLLRAEEFSRAANFLGWSWDVFGWVQVAGTGSSGMEAPHMTVLLGSTVSLGLVQGPESEGTR